MVKAGREKVEIILLWCKRKWGKSKFKKGYPKLRVYSSAKGTYNSSRTSFGTYNYITNTINVHICHHKSYMQLIDTVIHEYKHYLLDDKEYKRIERLMYKKGYSPDYVDDYHPHEKKSARLAKVWSAKCLFELRKELYRKNKKC
jgi:hypothetical protein